MPSTRRTRLNEQVRGFVFAAILVAACVITAMAFPDRPTGPRYEGAGGERRRGGTFVFHHESDVRGFDPHISFDELSNIGIKLMFDGLLDYHHDTSLYPRLAEEMPWQSEDGRTFRFKLRRGVRFHNGREVTSEDVRWSMEHMLDPKIGSPGFTFYTQIDGLDEYRAALTALDERIERAGNDANRVRALRRERAGHHISGIRVLDRYNVEFHLKAPDQTFLNAMAMTFSYPVPRENYAAHPEDVARHPVGTGAYMLEEWEPGVRVVFKRNPRYWREGEPYVDRQVFELNLNRDTAFMRFQSGELDHVHRFSPADYLFIKQARRWRPYLDEGPKVNLWGLVMNCELPPFDNVHVRRAVAFAIDRDRWDRTRAYRLEPTGQPIPPGLLAHDPNLEGRHVFDLRRAREEMRLAGFPNGIPEPVTLWIGESATGKVYGELAQHDLERIGITVELKPVAFPVFLQATGKPRTAQALITGWSMDFPDPSNFLDILFHSRAIHDHDSENKAFYRNAELDALLDRARVERDRTRRAEMYRRASRILVDDAPWAFIWNDTKLEAWQPYVHDYSPHPVWDEFYRDIWLDLPRRRIARFEARSFATRLASLLPLPRGDRR